METQLTDAEIFTHIRVIVGMVLGLSVARLINGMMRFIQHPGRESVSIPHLLWTTFLLLSIIHFWWFEVAFVHHGGWTFSAYVVLLLYAGLFVALAAILFPDSTVEYGGLANYFERRNRAFYVLLLLMFLVDIPDTLFKGHDYYTRHLGIAYPVRVGVLAGGTVIALIWPARAFRLGFAGFALIFEIAWIIGRYALLA